MRSPRANSAYTTGLVVDGNTPYPAQVMIGLEPCLKNVSISSLSQASGSPIMAAALMSYGFAALLIPSYFARAISISPTNASYSDKMIYFAFPIAVPLMLLLVEALRRKIKPVQKTHYFISCTHLPCPTCPFARCLTAIDARTLVLQAIPSHRRCRVTRTSGVGVAHAPRLRPVPPQTSKTTATMAHRSSFTTPFSSSERRRGWTSLPRTGQQTECSKGSRGTQTSP